MNGEIFFFDSQPIECKRVLQPYSWSLNEVIHTFQFHMSLSILTRYRDHPFPQYSFRLSCGVFWLCVQTTQSNYRALISICMSLMFPAVAVNVQKSDHIRAWCNEGTHNHLLCAEKLRRYFANAMDVGELKSLPWDLSSRNSARIVERWRSPFTLQPQQPHQQ